MHLNTSMLTEVEQASITKMLMRLLPHRNKHSTDLGVSRQCTPHVLEKWALIWYMLSSCSAIFPVKHGYFERELLDENAECDLTKKS